MEPEFFKSAMDLGVTGAFLIYLYYRNGKQEKAMTKMADGLNRNTKVLIKVAQKHKLLDEVEELINE